MLESSTSLTDSGERNPSKISPSNYQEENSRLLKANIELNNQLSNIRSQYDQALQLTSQVENITSTNRKYAKEVSELKAEKDDYQRRLQIALQNNQELNQKLRSARTNDDPPIQQRRYQMQPHNPVSDQVISNLKQQLEKALSENDKLTQELHRINIQTESIYQASSQYFHTIIDSPQALINSFSNNFEKQSMKDKKLQSQIKQLYKKLRKKQSIIDSQMMNYDELQKSINMIQNEKSDKHMELTIQINDLMNRNNQLSSQIDDLSKKNMELNEEITKKNAQIKYNIVENDDSKAKEIRRLTAESDTFKTAYEKEHQRYKTMKKKFVSVSCNYQSLAAQCTAYEEDIKNLENKKAELKRITIENSEQFRAFEFKIKDQETETLRAKDEIALHIKEEEKLKDEISQLKNKIKGMEREFKELNSEKDGIISEKMKLENQIQAYETKLQVSNELQMQKEKQLKEALQPTDPNTLIPSSLLNSPDFPNDLQSTLGEIARNTALHISIRIQSIFSTIAKWYRTYRDDYEQKIIDEKQKFNALRVQVDTLIDFLKRMMPSLKINFDLLLTDEQTRSILADCINNLREVQQIKPQIDELKEILNIHKIEDGKTAVIQMRKSFAELNKRIKVLKDQKKKLKKALKFKINEYESIIDDFNKKNVSMKGKCDEYSDKIYDLQKQIVIIEDQHKQDIETIRNEYDQKITQLNSDINTLTLLAQNNDSLKEEIAKLTKKKERLESQIKIILSQKEEEEKKYKARIKQEKERFDNFTEQSKKQIIEGQNSIRQLNETIIKIRTENESLSSRNNELNLRIQKMDTRVAVIQSEYERDKKQIESQNNAKLLFAENEYKSRIDDKQRQIDVIKQRMVDSISRLFAQQLDGLKVDESNIEGALQVVRKKTDDLLSRELRLRTILGIDSRQSIEEVVSLLANRKRRRNSVYY
ncbi:hypothetical protein M9Y10_040811 [Tritrichomonas musculus]|uniref:Uncharacterized protein n=1 Tax=Tritrichomonas musculus TaxID=1915356 RepID=A0ABR2K2R5_9EUKA